MIQHLILMKKIKLKAEKNRAAVNKVPKIIDDSLNQ